MNIMETPEPGATRHLLPRGNVILEWNPSQAAGDVEHNSIKARSLENFTRFLPDDKKTMILLRFPPPPGNWFLPIQLKCWDHFSNNTEDQKQWVSQGCVSWAYELTHQCPSQGQDKMSYSETSLPGRTSCPRNAKNSSVISLKWFAFVTN